MDETKNYLPQIPEGKDLIVEVPDFLKEDEWFEVDIEANLLDVTKEYDLPRFSLNINGVPCAPIGGLHGITGQPGHGKTMTLTMIMAAYLGDTRHGMSYGLGEVLQEPKILYIDTEMEPENTMMVNLRVCAMLGWGYHEVHDNFKIMCLRNELSAEDRWKKVLKGIYQFKPNMVFIDGLIDIVADFNDNKQCQEIIFRLMNVASYYDISVWTILHQNPNSPKMVGHAGSFLERKATDIFETKKEKNELTGNVSFKIIQRKARGKDIPDVSFTVNDEKHKFGIPVIDDSRTDTSNLINQQEEQRRRRELVKIFSKIDFKKDGLSWTELSQELTSRFAMTSNRKRKDTLDDAQELGILQKINKKYYFNSYCRSDEAEQEEIDFKKDGEETAPL